MALGKAAKVDPDREMRELANRKQGHAKRRDELEVRRQVLTRKVEGQEAREKAALKAEEDGEVPAESLAEIRADVAEAAQEVSEIDKRLEAVREKESRVDAEKVESFDRHLGHYTAKAEAASEAAAEAIAAAAGAARAAAASWKAASERWSEVRTSRRRHGRNLPGVPVSDFGGAVSELSKSYSRPYPGGSLEAWERWRAESEGVQARRVASEPELVDIT
jgi:DNA repair exonuclease SbcCD ATPase subunit